MTLANTTTDIGETWRAALDHAAGCPDCRAADDGCATGQSLVHTYQQARRAHHAEGTQ
ncbi:hypothetical protein [Streptomyces sp. NPDC059850]|uniref:hypothetical protein n=1 Tax=Streptomyces sp. NPDC059850 TaxID=3346970 RepID=UPI00365520D2